MANRTPADWDGYPLTVAADRYGGCYSQGAWVAFALHPDAVPRQPWEDDGTAASYWGGEEERDPILRKFSEIPRDEIRHPRFVGRGATADEAVADLRRRLSG